METILNWSWPRETVFRFYLVQFFFWSGYAIIVGMLGTFPYFLTRFRQTAWTTFVLGAMGTLMAYLSQFLFKLDRPLDMISPYAVSVAIFATFILAPILSLFVFVCQPVDDEIPYEASEKRRSMSAYYNDDGYDAYPESERVRRIDNPQNERGIRRNMRRR